LLWVVWCCRVVFRGGPNLRGNLFFLISLLTIGTRWNDERKLRNNIGPDELAVWRKQRYQKE
jgi:hypothetical protein